MMRRRDQTGFTLLETIAVLAVIGILTALSLPPIMKMVLEQPKLDEAKNKMNTAIAECLRLSRDSSIALSSVTPPSLSGILPGSYQFASIGRSYRNNCSDVAIEDTSKRLPTLAFGIINGQVFKESALPSSNTEYESECKSWGNCNGLDPNATTLKNCATERQVCEVNLQNRLNQNGQTVSWQGTCSAPRDNLTGCIRPTWIYSQKVYYSQNDFNLASAASASQACNELRNNERQRSSNTATFTPSPNACGNTKLYWVNGQETDACSYDYEKWKSGTAMGIYEPPISSDCRTSKLAVRCRRGNRNLVFEGTRSCPVP